MGSLHCGGAARPAASPVVRREATTRRRTASRSLGSDTAALVRRGDTLKHADIVERELFLDYCHQDQADRPRGRQADASSSQSACTSRRRQSGAFGTAAGDDVRDDVEQAPRTPRMRWPPTGAVPGGTRRSATNGSLPGRSFGIRGTGQEDTATPSAARDGSGALRRLPLAKLARLPGLVRRVKSKSGQPVLTTAAITATGTCRGSYDPRPSLQLLRATSSSDPFALPSTPPETVSLP